MADIEFTESGLVIIRCPKCILALSREQFLAAIKEGKAWRRRQALVARLTPAHDPLPSQTP